MKFPYLKFKGRLLPIVPVRLKGKEWISVDAYVDSGASFSIFHAWITEALGLKIEEGEKQYVIVGDGSQIPVYLHSVKVQLAEKEFEVKIGFSRRLGIGFNLLGRVGVFDRFKVCFNDKEGAVEFSEFDI
mgnify:CR=1 FL=1